MLRCAHTSSLLVASAALVACTSNGSGGVQTGGAGHDVIASSGSGEPSASGGMVSGGIGAGGSGARAGLPSGGSSPSGGTSASASAGSESMGGDSSTSGGTSASGGAGGDSTSGGSSASGGSQSVGGASGVGGSGGSGGGAAGSGGTPSFATCPDETWNLVWGDDFDGAAGEAVDGSKWAYDSGPNWYNGELQAYTTGTANASMDGNGNLVIEARNEEHQGRQYTSARLKTEGRQTFTYGRFEGRMKMPYGQGMWPAFWLLGGNAWPGDGEIDIMEHLGREPSIAHGTIHGPGYSGADGPGESFTLPDGAGFADDFHIFAIEWEANAIRWYIDGELYSTKTPADTNGNPWVFDHGFFFIVNLAVGGDWPGDPDETTVFPQRMLIDYIRVCEN